MGNLKHGVVFSLERILGFQVSWPQAISSITFIFIIYLYSTITRYHQQNVKWFGSHNWTTQQLWTATPILPDAPRYSQMGWMQSHMLAGAPRLIHRHFPMLRKLWIRIEEYPTEHIVLFNMLQNQTIKMFKFRSYWEYWPHPYEYSGAPRTWSQTLCK